MPTMLHSHDVQHDQSSKVSERRRKRRLLLKRETLRLRLQMEGVPLESRRYASELTACTKIRSELDVVEKRVVTHLRNCESAHTDDFPNGLGKKFEVTPSASIEGVQQLSESLAYKVVFHDLSHSLWDGLYIGDISSSRIDPFLMELEKNLTVIAETVDERVRTRILTDIMRASFDGFLLVMLAGGPSRAFTIQDSQVMEEDFKSMKDFFWANGDGLAMDLIDKFSTTVRGVLPLFS